MHNKCWERHPELFMMLLINQINKEILEIIRLQKLKFKDLRNLINLVKAHNKIYRN